MAQLTQEDIEYLKNNGYDPNSFQVQEEQPQGRMSDLGAVGTTLKGHAGGILGGGAGAIGGTALGVALAPETGGLSLGIPLLAGALGGAAGGTLGQKTQQGLQSNETNEAQEQSLEQAQREHPYISMATDIGASALASGGSPSIRTPLRALMGDSKALKSIAINSAVNPAINSGINLATTGQLPSMSDLGMQALGGAVMSGNRNPLGRLTGLGTHQEPTDKNNVPDISSAQDNQTLQLNAPRQPLGLLGRGGPRFYGGDNGKPIIDVYSQVVPHPDLSGDEANTGLHQSLQDIIDEEQSRNTQPNNDVVPNDANTIEQQNQQSDADRRAADLTKAKDEQVSQTYDDTNPTPPTRPLSDRTGEIGAVGKLNTKGGQALQDWVDYQEANKRMQEAEPGSDEWMQAWKDREDVKNRETGSRPKGSTSEEPVQKETKPTQEVPPNKEVPPNRGVTGQPKTVPPNVPTNRGVTGESGFFSIPWLTKSAVDRVSDISHPGAPEIAKGAKRALNEQQELRGQFKNPIVEAGSKLTAQDKQRINDIKNQEVSTGQLHPPTANDTEAVKNYYKVAKKMYNDTGDYSIQNKIPVVDRGAPRLMKKDPSHWAGMANQKVEDIYRKNTDQASINKLDAVFDDWNQHDLGMTVKGSKSRIELWKAAIRGDFRNSDMSHQDFFNALRKAQGSQLPPEFREQNPVKNDSRYADRFATAATFYKHMESNPKIMAALGQDKDAWGKDIPQIYKEGGLANNPDVKNLIHQFHSSPEDMNERRERSFSGIATAGLIAGPPLEVHKVISNQVKALSFARNPIQLITMLAHGLTNIKEGYIHAKENGLVKLTANSVMDMFNGALTAAERMNGVARAIRQVATLGDLTTKFNAGMIQAQMEYLIPSKIQRAEHGSVTDQKFLQNLDPDYKVGKWYTKDEMQKLASTAASYIHGTGDVRQMPGWMMGDSEVSGFFNLAHWSVAQTNNFVKDVLEPAQRGDLTPLLTSVFGAAVGGYLIKELRQDISGKKNPIPSLQEIQAGEGGLAAHKSLLAYNLIAAMQYSGFGGLLSQVAKYPFDFAYKNQPQGATFPLDELASDLAGTIHHVSEAIANDPNVNWIDLSAAVSQHLLQSNVMLSRIAINQGINAGLITGLPAEKKALTDRLNQLRRFDEIQGLPYNDIDSASNPYMNLEQKKFKYNENPQEAVQQLPELIHGIMTAYQGKPDVIMSKLKGLKENQYSTFPSMEQMPIEFMKYLGFLQREKGPEEAQAELQDYMKHRIENEAKASVVP